MPDTYTRYRTLTGPAEGTYTEKRSKFYAHAVPVSTVDEAMAVVADLRRKYYDARHVCWAYVIGKREREERANDDGEPSSTAGKPILGQIISRDLTDVVVVVARYFGGVKLGTGGLIVAYRSVAEAALDTGTVEEHLLYVQYRLRFPFDLINPVMMLLRSEGAQTLSSDTDTEGYIWDVEVPDKDVHRWEVAASTLYRLHCKRKD